MFIREDPEKTLQDLVAELDEPIKRLRVDPDDLTVLLKDEDHRVFQLTGGTEIPVTLDGLTALGNWFDIPTKFLVRLDPDQQEWLLKSFLERNRDVMLFCYCDKGVQDIRDPNAQTISPLDLVNAMMDVVDPKAYVIEMVLTTAFFHLDVIATDSIDFAVGGDTTTGDLTRGGLRVYRDAKHNLAPSVVPFLYRLEGTNGLITRQDGLQVDGRGKSAEEVMEEFGSISDQAFHRVEKDIESFYAAKAEVIDNPEQRMLRLCKEQGLPVRTAMNLVETVPTVTDNEGQATLFDLVNLISNAANNPDIANRYSARRALEEAAGAIVVEHAARCDHCQSKLSNF